MWNKPLRNFSFCGVLALLAVAAANAARFDEPRPTSQDTQLAQEVRALSAELLRERVIDLPEDAGVWHTIVVYPDRERSDTASRRLAAALASDERLRSLTAQTKTHIYALGDPLWRERLQQHYGSSAPALIVQRPDGRVCYKASGANLPSDPRALASDIAAAIADCRPKPSPAPSPAPAPQPAPTIPDLAPRQPANNEEDQQVLWMIAVPMIAGLLGLYQEWKTST
jgi:hypothetical protein